jgi:hypothetical protein
VGQGESPTRLEIDCEDAGAAMRAFVSWAGSEQDLKVLFTPDVLMAIDVPQRRGVLLDEVYFVTVWVDRGVAAFRDCLRAELPSDQVRWTEVPAGQDPDPERLLSSALTHGRPITTARHLL